ncbi:MAG: hypothetical protein AVDCRST_MAG89-3641 [uncultured Gemmatimonadetes bacterium]|uniref:Uncharacterized protein n=1 Tax=uncultured Gemmatimonadota bacterium TaxID=203437 RepID=A0A6J4MH63_9BACT|nr:MAG: hypothetical protein AVDCRST_MAG89-3641 [uncultured Gemmatimonadota bacterium]
MRCVHSISSTVLSPGATGRGSVSRASVPCTSYPAAGVRTGATTPICPAATGRSSRPSTATRPSVTPPVGATMTRLRRAVSVKMFWYRFSTTLVSAWGDRLRYTILSRPRSSAVRGSSSAWMRYDTACCQYLGPGCPVRLRVPASSARAYASVTGTARSMGRVMVSLGAGSATRLPPGAHPAASSRAIAIVFFTSILRFVVPRECTRAPRARRYLPLLSCVSAPLREPRRSFFAT